MAAPSQHVLGIDPKMYRHFTVLTLVISLTVAFFANGEQKRALDRDVPVKAVQNDKPNKPDKADKKAHAAPSEMDALNGVSGDPSPVRMNTSPPPPAPASDDAPIDAAAPADGQFSAKPNRFTYRRPGPRFDPSALARMSPDQRAGYLGAAGGEGVPGGLQGSGSGGPSQQQLDRLVAKSRARSGGVD